MVINPDKLKKTVEMAGAVADDLPEALVSPRALTNRHGESPAGMAKAVSLYATGVLLAFAVLYGEARKVGYPLPIDLMIVAIVHGILYLIGLAVVIKVAWKSAGVAMSLRRALIATMLMMSVALPAMTLQFGLYMKDSWWLLITLLVFGIWIGRWWYTLVPSSTHGRWKIRLVVATVAVVPMGYVLSEVMSTISM